MPTAVTNTIIVLTGFAGTGKYTIGRELADRIDAKLIHNHLISDMSAGESATVILQAINSIRESGQ